MYNKDEKYWQCKIIIFLPVRNYYHSGRITIHVYVIDIYIYIYINIWKSSQRMNLRDVGLETSVNDTVQTNKNDK
jgi:hypothetical protein